MPNVFEEARAQAENELGTLKEVLGLTPNRTDFERWKRWDAKNPTFYDLFRRFTLQAIRAGRKELSGWLVANRIRWETEVVTLGSEWKVPNGCIAYYTRLFMAEYPQHDGLFETRPLKHSLAEGELERWLYERVGLEPEAPQYPEDGGLKVQVRPIGETLPMGKVFADAIRAETEKLRQLQAEAKARHDRVL